MEIKKLYNFVHDGIEGSVYPDGMVAYGGACFQIEAAGPELLASIKNSNPKK